MLRKSSKPALVFAIAFKVAIVDVYLKASLLLHIRQFQKLVKLFKAAKVLFTIIVYRPELHFYEKLLEKKLKFRSYNLSLT